MQRTVKRMFLAMIFASALPLMACSDSDTPTSPTQPGPPVDNRPIVSVTGPVINLSRTGEGGLDVTFRIDDFTIVRAGASTPVIDGSSTSQTDALRTGQNVTVEGRRDGGFLDATKVTINSK
jgi:hypothetical protein